MNARGIESRAGCHCATLAHQQLGLDIPASCRLSFYFYNTLDEVDRAVDALEAVLSGNRVREKIWSWLRSRPTTRLRRVRGVGGLSCAAPAPPLRLRVVSGAHQVRRAAAAAAEHRLVDVLPGQHGAQAPIGWGVEAT